MVEIGIFLAVFVALVISREHVASKHTFMDGIMDKVDHLSYKVCNIRSENMNWKKYALSLVIVNGLMLILAYFILRLQGFYV